MEQKAIDASLVDVQGTLILGFSTLNAELYQAMLKAKEQGENIFIYSSYCSPKFLKDRGVDTTLFPIISKRILSSWETGVEYIVTGKIIDDEHPQKWGIKMTNPNNYIYPDQKNYEFSRDPIPAGVEIANLRISK